MQDLIINEELKNLLPPLSAEVFTELEAGILKDGCISPLIVWNNILVDGHHRYEICTKHCIPFSVHQLGFSNLGEAKMWRWENQANRRNLTPFHRAEIALRLKGIIAAKAKERQRRNREPHAGEPIETRQELADIACTSTNTIDKVTYLVNYADSITKERLRRGEKGMSINSEYKRLKTMSKEKYRPVTPSQDEKTTSSKATYYAEQVSDVLLILFEKYRKCWGSKSASRLVLQMLDKCINEKNPD